LLEVLAAGQSSQTRASGADRRVSWRDTDVKTRAALPPAMTGPDPRTACSRKLGRDWSTGGGGRWFGKRGRAVKGRELPDEGPEEITARADNCVVENGTIWRFREAAPRLSARWAASGQTSGRWFLGFPSKTKGLTSAAAG